MITIPEKIAKKARELGLDLESMILEAIMKELNLSRNEEIEVRLEIAENSLKEAKNYLNKGNSVQASEKLYKVVEECVKILAQLYEFPECEKAKSERRWWIQLLGKSARKLTRILGEPMIEQVWAIAYDLHVWGFHEAKYDIEDIKDDVKYAEWIIEYTKKIVEKKLSTK